MKLTTTVTAICFAAAASAFATPTFATHATPYAAPPDDQWTWVDVASSHCGNGSATGYAVNPHASSTQLMIYLEGGGECTDGASCWSRNPTAVNMNGYSSRSFKQDGTVYAPYFLRTGNSPFAATNQVLVPYCTGDLHIGTAVADYALHRRTIPTYHMGGNNLVIYLGQLAAEFPNVDHVWISGSSAGGYGSFLNQYYVVQAFPAAAVDVISDSGPAVPFPALGVPAQWGPHAPPDCTSCLEDVSDYYLYDRAKYPSSRFALLTYEHDSVLPSFYDESQADFDAQLQTFLTSLGGSSYTQYFEILGTGHVVLGDSSTDAQTTLLNWLGLMTSESPGWNSVTYSYPTGS